jgi:hypothetical protein
MIRPAQCDSTTVQSLSQDFFSQVRKCFASRIKLTPKIGIEGPILFISTHSINDIGKTCHLHTTIDIILLDHDVYGMLCTVSQMDTLFMTSHTTFHQVHLYFPHPLSVSVSEKCLAGFLPPTPLKYSSHK